MNQNWNKIEWIFEKDGALRDIYIQNVQESDWMKTIDLLNSKFKLSFGIYERNLSDRIDKNFVKTMFADKTGELETKSATIYLDKIIVKCYFFLENQIEFDINPTEIKSKTELDLILDFMKSLSNKLEKQVTLSGENQPEFPLIKIDTKNGIEKILTEQDAQKLWKISDQNVSGLSKLKSKIIMKYFPKTFEKRIIESATSEYKATPKEKNVW